MVNPLFAMIYNVNYVNMFTNFRGSLILLHISAFIESVLAAGCTLLVSSPTGSFMIESCPVNALSDWYPVFYNPTNDYVNTIHCTYEVVYPL